MKNPVYILSVIVLFGCSSNNQDENFKSISEVSKDSRPVQKQSTDTTGRSSLVNALVTTGDTKKSVVPTNNNVDSSKIPSNTNNQEAKVINSNHPNNNIKIIKPTTIIAKPKTVNINTIPPQTKSPTIKTKPEDEDISVEEFTPLNLSKSKQSQKAKPQNNSYNQNSNNSAPAQQVIGHINATNFTSGSSIIIILKGNLPTDDGVIEAGQRIAAIGYISGGRLNLRFNSAIVNSRIIEIKAKCYDQSDGLEGINLGEQSLKTGSTSGARNAINSVANGVASMVPGLGGRAAQGVTQGMTGSLSSKNISYKLPNTDVLLVTKSTTNFNF